MSPPAEPGAYLIELKNVISGKIALKSLFSAFLLRHRMHSEHRDFLHLKSPNGRNSQRAKELLDLLQEASNSGVLNAELKDNIDQIREHILYRGTNSIIDITVEDDDTDNGGDDDSDNG